MNLRYVWKLPLPIKGGGKQADPQVVGEALEKITKDGNLDAKDVVEAARPRKSPLHRYFEWDDAIAAEAHRRDQARHLIGALRLISNENEPPARAYLSLHMRADGIRYRQHEKVAGSDELQVALLQQALAELRSMRTRYRSLIGLCRGLDKIIGEFDEGDAEAA